MFMLLFGVLIQSGPKPDVCFISAPALPSQGRGTASVSLTSPGPCPPPSVHQAVKGPDAASLVLILVLLDPEPSGIRLSGCVESLLEPGCGEQSSNLMSTESLSGQLECSGAT